MELQVIEVNAFVNPSYLLSRDDCFIHVACINLLFSFAVYEFECYRTHVIVCAPVVRELDCSS